MSAKASLRRHFRPLRQTLLESVEAAIVAQARQHVPALLPAGRALGLYWPLPGEVDLRSLQALLPNQLALPAIIAAPGDPAARLVYRPWRAGDPLEPDSCRIPAPLAGAGELPAQALGLLLVPALACDAAGIRLGYGGGWYDRLRADPTWAQVPALAVLPRGCRVEQLPRDPWDVPLQGWIDEEGLGHSSWGNPS
ncbi:5-formyltetrahydrofolate cyclo-ligase [Cyanobium sp. Maggiore-St4-Cus]|uniref:5-formyltetrahydrofolate cyclo-ligase n=1 Tax=Cyanobium sp. Maggiore-St4-Cus TaxID=2823717 RepID=UPI0020CB7915|nr:5-formyltetrahydrofolate cyclo-ligase [Cyanobium sp. Maggiore-St4-Cus]MCP9789045.1 5-formyltetrahydrofolate cyclo-ligase [Cyanobium sp. Maggiore-St4-Cus]